MRIHLSILLLCVVMVSVSCKKKTKDGDATIAAVSMANVSYGADARQNMDVYLPANRSTASTKFIIMIHGGGWTGGDKADFIAFVDTLKSPEFATTLRNKPRILTQCGLGAYGKVTQMSDIAVEKLRHASSA